MFRFLAVICLLAAAAAAFIAFMLIALAFTSQDAGIPPSREWEPAIVPACVGGVLALIGVVLWRREEPERGASKESE